jgi:LmbE family N-acetylglucosaminyl deacetylase
VPLERDLVPYEATTAIPANRVLVLAPHADDEVFGCGGAIASHVRSGVPVRVVIMSDGAAGGAPAQRQKEARAAAQVLGYGEPEFWGLPDRGLRCDESTLERLALAIQDFAADLLYAPSPWEVHPDHRQTAALAAETARRTGIRVAYYEVGMPLRPNVLLDITALADTKSRAMRCFASQLAVQGYDKHIEGLNRFRTYTLPAGVAAAEAYLLLSAQDIDTHGIAGAGADVQSLALGGVASPSALQADTPLVSILVRSLDRTHLQEALDSIALQTYPRIEVVVVAAQPGHQALPARCGRFPLRLVQTDEALPRSRAANRALQQASGDWLMFLDDDDWLMPAHVARLAHVLSAQPHCLAAYTGVALAGENQTWLGQVFDLPFDSVRQLAGNLTPIHAVLFSRQLLAQGCRFDESLDRFEDWDFWLQVASHGPMVHLPGVSAAYRIHESSGVHEDSGPQGEPTQKIYEKWRATWDDGKGAALMQRAWVCADLEIKLDQANRHIEGFGDVMASHAQLSSRLSEQIQSVAQLTHSVGELTETNARLSSALTHESGVAQAQARVAAERQNRIDELLGSTSWRLTAPLRWLSAQIKARR